MPQSLWGAVRRTIPMGLIYGAGFQPLMVLVNLPPGALPQAGMKRAFGASSLWKMIDRPLPKCTNSKSGYSACPAAFHAAAHADRPAARVSSLPLSESQIHFLSFYLRRRKCAIRTCCDRLTGAHAGTVLRTMHRPPCRLPSRRSQALPLNFEGSRTSKTRPRGRTRTLWPY